MIDETEDFRRQQQAELNEAAALRSELEKQYGQVWSTDELRRDFRVMAFAAPYVVVVRLEDNQKGTLEFQHSPRQYFNFMADKGR